MISSTVQKILSDGIPWYMEKTIVSSSSKQIGIQSFASSERLGWESLQLEAGFRPGWLVDERMVNGHQIMMNLDDGDICLETRGDSAWIEVRLAPLELWIIPEGRQFSVRKMTDARYALCVIDGRSLDSVVGCHFELDAAVGIRDPVLARLLQALIAIVEDTASYSQALATEVIRTFISSVAVRHGHPAAELKIKGGIAPSQMKSLLTWLEVHLEEPLTVGMMATQVGLSAAHFSREFKRSTGATPWDYVVRLRLERVRDSLMNGGSLAPVSQQFGFSDQSHMARLFRHRFGLSPSAYLKANKERGPAT